MAELLRIEADFTPFISQLAQVSKNEWPKVLASALNESGYYALNKYKSTLPSYFDRPTQYTINSMYLKKATPTDLNASIQWKTSTTGGSAGKYLQPEVFGGAREQKGFEKALQSAGRMPQGFQVVPGSDAPLDSFGNVPAAIYQAVLKYLQANPTTQAAQQFSRLKNMGFSKLVKGAARTALKYEKKAAAEARKAAKNSRYFTIQPGDKSSLPIGIYERTSSGGSTPLSGGANQKSTSGGRLGIRRLFSFVRSTRYKVSYPFEQIGDDAVKSKFPEKLQEAITAALAKAAKK